ncbi:family 78 glycoside hydrolase catalytic domain [Microbacterium trichothecenolyticum]|uniref:family 78 glycoside hydrolase catalytic domain n=1 Tax=Microbacterium trichothecenolyticum TaxID=69370 RepID=UPI001C6DE8B9|nr:family 78 glycoside hydrolase catalytic domain [Microbacterium trichothecenolyticum]MBW9121876.1 family 78 glycoside hydrolase catalytic domain [Microbacterium trichothecenolyticum]
MAPYDLRVEHLRAPIGVGIHNPRFSWFVDHVRAASELEVSTAGKVVWASGEIETHDAAPVVYAGESLISNTAYAWRVRSRTAEGDWSEWAGSTFETSLLDPSDWVAPWIEPVQQEAVVERWSIIDWIRGLGPDSPPEERLRPAQLLRQRFEVGPGAVRARLFATARGVYSAYVNGERSDDHVLAPGFDSYEHRVSFSSADVTAALVEGENVLGVALADGWWAGRIGLTGSSAQFGTRTSAIWQLHIDYADGTTQIVPSGADVRSAIGPWGYADLFVGESFDRSAVPRGWDRPRFDDDGWMPVAEVGRDHAVLVPLCGEPVRRVREVRPVALVESAEGTIVDFGQVLVGRVRLHLRDTTPGQPVVIEHTETLAADGSWFANIAGINKEQTDIFLAAGGPDEWEPEFTFHGFRYARVSGLSTELSVDEVVAVVLASDLDETGSFEASDPRLDRLHQNVVWSQRGNFLSVPTDCPQRERAGWTGDIQAFVGAATNNAQVVPFLERWLDNLRSDQLPDGRIPIFSPRSPFDAEAAAKAQGVGAIVSAAGWSDAIAIVPWTLYERTGDPRALEENFEAMLDWIEYQRATARAELPASLAGLALDEARADAQALLYNTGAQFGDWLTPSTMEGRPTHEAIGIAPALTGEYLAPMFQAHTLTIAARAAAVLGRRTDAADLAERAAQVRAAFAAEYVDAYGDLPVRLQGLYVVALAFDMIPTELRAHTAARLVELIRERGNRLDTGFLSTPYLLDVLCDSGYLDVARTLLWQSEMPSWLYEVDRGATTIWEAWDAISPDGEIRPMSFNHCSPGSVDDFLYRRVAGIRSTAPGYRTAVIAPDFRASLTHVRAHVGTPFGRLAVEWSIAGDTASVTVDVPWGVTARLLTPGGGVAVEAGRSRHFVAVEQRS